MELPQRPFVVVVVRAACGILVSPPGITPLPPRHCLLHRKLSLNQRSPSSVLNLGSIDDFRGAKRYIYHFKCVYLHFSGDKVHDFH